MVLAMSGYNTSRDELYLRLSPDCSTEPITNNSAFSDDLSEDEQLFYKTITRFPHFEITNTILVSIYSLYAKFLFRKTS